MTRRITATQAARPLPRLLDRVRHRGEEFVVERGGEAVCRIGPVSPSSCSVVELSRTLEGLPRLGARHLAGIERITRRQPRAPRSPWR